jgi:hypothetical protein
LVIQQWNGEIAVISTARKARANGLKQFFGFTIVKEVVVSPFEIPSDPVETLVVGIFEDLTH